MTRASERSMRRPRIEPTATSRASRSTSITGMARLIRATDWCRYGPIRKATPSEVVPRAPMTPSSHMLGWKRGTRARMRPTIAT